MNILDLETMLLERIYKSLLRKTNIKFDNANDGYLLGSFFLLYIFTKYGVFLCNYLYLPSTSYMQKEN